MELLHLVDTVVLDKTGTITKGTPKVTDIISEIEEKEILRIAGSLEKNSEHPLAEAIIEKVKENKIEFVEVKEFNSISGRGIKGKIDGKDYFGGNIAFMRENNINIDKITKQSDKLLKQGKTVIYFANKNDAIGIIAVADTVKDTSFQSIKELKRKNIEVVMITRR